MLSARLLFDSPLVRIAEVRCTGDPGWSGEEPVSGLGVVLVRRGLFRRRVDGVDQLLDPAAAYVQVPGTTQQVAHPCGGDLCTVLAPGPQLLGESMDLAELGSRLLFPSAALAARHRVLLARARLGGEELELAEEAALLLGELVVEASVGPGRRPRRNGRARRDAERARELLAQDDDLSPRALANELDTTIYALSRAFRANTGTTLSAYRRRLRTQRVLEELDRGHRHLAALAAECGFADQAHLTRVLRSETGKTPGVWRALLGRGRN